ncbi:hypothetical protein G647_04295 [Cladophialophora carrionii CBS 160.54]|uniref:Uncharacterized protein n=1 Tax=Cladophialophora carrionii CBS 160.54 TaxID=1279043 RepID=V9DDL0_9EURO|nr:uncharacterized protein G647_04295 [Cladophialophora carrionii CBS 160.54]ETI24925.1 hypothetical protein G647_04295 [Cladophialophora carrionii CBS 160.54]
MPTSYTIGGRTPAITKPFAVMTIEELLDTLPDCDSGIISQHWLPAMRLQIEKMIGVLNEAGNLQMESSVDQVTLNSVLKTFSDQMRAITAEYRKVVEQAESLAERDGKANKERVKALEEQVEEALELMDAKDKEIEERDQRVSELRNTVHEIARLLGTFIQNNLPSWVETINEPRTQQVLRIIADYTRNDSLVSVDYLRIPEETLNKYAADVREARNLVGEYRKVLHGQSAMIKDQSQNLDAHAVKYEKAVKMVREKDHEILLLVQKNDDLTKQLQENQSALAESRETATEAEVMTRCYEELRGNMESLKTAHELELDQKDAEIANLRQKLGSAREEVFARREDVKNVVAQTQAMLHTQPDPYSAAAKSSNTSKALRFFGMEKDKYKKGIIPASQSTLGLSSVDARYSSKEVAPGVSKEALWHRPSLQTHTNQRSARTAPNTPVDRTQGSGVPAWTPAANQAPADPVAPAPPRSDSLGYGSSNTTSPISPINKDKPLPADPMSMSQLATARLASITSSMESPLQAQIASDYLSHGIMGQTSQTARRVLSRITEVSTPKSRRSQDEDQRSRLENVHEDDGSDHSVGSSDREVYRKSICALDMLNSSSDLASSGTETDIERIMRGAGITGGTGSPPPRLRNTGRHPAATYSNNNWQENRQDNDQDIHTGVARVLHLRAGTRDLRRAGGSHNSDNDHHAGMRDGEIGVVGQERAQLQPQFARDRDSSGESTQDRRECFTNPARESVVSTGSSAGYRTEDSEPKTVAQLYHMSGRHIRG